VPGAGCRRRILTLLVCTAAAALVLGAPAVAQAALPSHDPSDLAASAAVQAADASGERPAPSIGSLKTIALLVDFPDFAHQTDATFFNDLIFGDRVGLSSVRGYFREVSYGLLDVTTLDLPSNLGWLTVSRSKMYYIGDGGGYGTYPRNRESMVEEALAMADHLVDFSRYDCNGDGFVDNLLIVFAGCQGDYRDSNFQPQVCRLSHPVALDGVTARRFTMLPELKSAPGDMTIGLYAHEMGHIIGARDLYDSDLSSQGVGTWSLMARGCFLGDWAAPARPDAWTSAQLGWLRPQTINGPPRLLTIPWVGS
jgi:immune inhibitor A